jgi:hypothetical protein
MKKIKPKLATSLNVSKLDLGQIASDQPFAKPIEKIKMDCFREKTICLFYREQMDQK